MEIINGNLPFDERIHNFHIGYLIKSIKSPKLNPKNHVAMLLLWLYNISYICMVLVVFRGLSLRLHGAGWLKNGIARAMARITPKKNIACHEYNWNPRSNPRTHGLSPNQSLNSWIMIIIDHPQTTGILNP